MPLDFALLPSQQTSTGGVMMGDNGGGLAFPRSFNGQLALLGILLAIQFVFFFYWIQLPSPIFHSHVTAAHSFTNYGRIAAAPSSSELGLTWLEKFRSQFEKLSRPQLEGDGQAREEARSAGLPGLRRAWQLKYHMHSRSPYPWRWLDHTAGAYRTRQQLQQHLQEDTIHDARFGDGFDATEAVAPPSTLPTSAEPKLASLTPPVWQQPETHQEKQSTSPSVVSTRLHTPSFALTTDSQCNRVVGSGLLALWESSRRVFCEGQSAIAREIADDAVAQILRNAVNGKMDTTLPLPPSQLSCRSTTLNHMPPPTAPHSFCVVSNVFIELSTLSVADAPKFRAHYVMGKANHYHYQEHGTFLGTCKLTGDYNIQQISGDHQRDIVDGFGPTGQKQQEMWKEMLETVSHDKTLATAMLEGMSFETTAAINKKQLLVSSPEQTLLIITRENGEHVNLYHTMTDLYNTFLMVRHFDLQQNRKSTRVLFMDHHSPSPFDIAWQTVFSGGGRILRASELLEKGFGASTLLAPRAILVPPGYASPLYRFLLEDEMECRQRTDLFTEFADYFLSAFDIGFQPWTNHKDLEKLTGITPGDEKNAFRDTIIVPASSADASSSPPLHIVLVSRRPYDNFVDHRTISRQIFNEPVLLNFLKSGQWTVEETKKWENVRVDVVDFARISFKQQLTMMASTDILVGMHGAVSHSARISRASF